MKNDKFRNLANEWFELADRDLDTAEREFKNDGWGNIIGFLCQQGAEKYLKGFIVSHGLEIKEEFKTHDLVKLLNDCLGFDKGLEDLDEGCHELTKYYIESRYPAEAPKDYSQEKIKQAIEFAEEIKKAILEATEKK